MEILDNDLNAEIIGFGALNVDKHGYSTRY